MSFCLRLSVSHWKTETPCSSSWAEALLPLWSLLDFNVLFQLKATQSLSWSTFFFSFFLQSSFLSSLFLHAYQTQNIFRLRLNDVECLKWTGVQPPERFHITLSVYVWKCKWDEKHMCFTLLHSRKYRCFVLLRTYLKLIQNAAERLEFRKTKRTLLVHLLLLITDCVQFFTNISCFHSMLFQMSF